MVSSKNYSLVTGASSGIGRAIASELAGRGHSLVLVARRSAELSRIARDFQGRYGVAVHSMPRDLTDPNAASSLVDECASKGAEIDVLVNNAGVLHLGEFHTHTTEHIEQMVSLNSLSLAKMIHGFLPQMLRRKYGRIINIASNSALLPIPRLATYASSKSFVLHLTEALAEEYRGTGVTLTAVCPSVTKTDMLSSAQSESERELSIPDFVISTAEDVAREAVSGGLRGKVIVIPGSVNRATLASTEVQPRWLRRRILGLMSKLSS